MISLLLCFQIVFSVFVLQIHSQEEDVPIVLFETNMENIKCRLREDKHITVGNYKNHVRQGVYDNIIFHRVISSFMIQGGNHTRTRYGDQSIHSIPDEFSGNNHNTRGTIAITNVGPNTGSNQFFINVVYNSHLDGAHPVFMEGMDVVDEISNVNADTNDRSLELITFTDAQIIKEGHLSTITTVAQSIT